MRALYDAWADRYEQDLDAWDGRVVEVELQQLPTPFADTLVVTALPDFTIGVTPGSVTVKRKGQTSATVSVGSVGGFSSPVTLSVSGLPGRVTGSFSGNPLAPGGPSVLTFKATRFASKGTFTITVKGVGGGTTHTKTVTLKVTT